MQAVRRLGCAGNQRGEARQYVGRGPRRRIRRMALAVRSERL
jgi:hypothetical protein